MKVFILKPVIIDPPNSILDYFNQIYCEKTWTGWCLQVYECASLSF